jgi:hypothetical protein
MSRFIDWLLVRNPPPRGMFGHQPNRWNGPPPMPRPAPQPPTLKFPEIDEALLPNLLPTKETTA